MRCWLLMQNTGYGTYKTVVAQTPDRPITLFYGLELSYLYRGECYTPVVIERRGDYTQYVYDSKAPLPALQITENSEGVWVRSV